MSHHRYASSQALLHRARVLLVEASTSTTPEDRFLAAHLGALRTAAAILAAEPGPSPRRPSSAWMLLAKAQPEFAGHADAFDAGARVRAAIEAGVAGAVTAERADDEMRRAIAFLADAQLHLGYVPVLLAG
ncbi:MAG: uncharacterized protein JWN20_2647 [Jatrophihabitantaceae bacterium]|nr:uncharacterized protein [Jatrophihabitantaceae bacterium]